MTTDQTLVVDAVLDETTSITQSSDPNVNESTSGSQDIGLNLSLSFVDAGFADSLAGTAGADDDGSESVLSVTVHLSDADAVLSLSSAVGGVSVNDLTGGDWSITGYTSNAELTSAIGALQITVAEGFDDDIHAGCKIHMDAEGFEFSGFNRALLLNRLRTSCSHGTSIRKLCDPVCEPHHAPALMIDKHERRTRQRRVKLLEQLMKLLRRGVIAFEDDEGSHVQLLQDREHLRCECSFGKSDGDSCPDE